MQTILIRECARIWLEFCALYPKLDPFNPPVIQFNGRLSKTAAWIMTEPRIIEVSKKLYKGNEAEYSKVLIPHEVAHQVDVDLYGQPKRGMDHAGTWAEIMIRYGLPPDKYHNLKT